MICFETYWTMNAMGVSLIDYVGNSTVVEETYGAREGELVCLNAAGRINIDLMETALISEGKPATSDVDGNLGVSFLSPLSQPSRRLSETWCREGAGGDVRVCFGMRTPFLSLSLLAARLGASHLSRLSLFKSIELNLWDDGRTGSRIGGKLRKTCRVKTCCCLRRSMK